MTLRDQIKAVATQPLPREAVEAFGVTVYAKMLSVKERGEMEEHMRAEKDIKLRECLTVFATCDEQGQPIFTADDIPEISNWAAADVDAIVTTALALNRIGKKDVEDMEKNS